MSETNQIELRVLITKELFYKGSFGVFGAIPLTNTESVKLNDWGNFAFSGEMPQLLPDNEYDIVIEPTNHPKHGDGYGIVSVKYEKPTTVSGQQEFIKVMLTPKQSQAILKAYPNHKIIDLMQSGEFDYNKVEGIKEKKYEKIKHLLLNNLDIQDAVVELKDLKITFAAMKKLTEHFGTPQMVVQRVKENIYSLCKVGGFGFQKVDAYALNRGDDKLSKFRLFAGLEYLLHMEEQNGNSWVHEQVVIKQLSDILQIDPHYVKTLLAEDVPDRKEFYHKDERVALHKNYYYELHIMKRLHKINDADSIVQIDDFEEVISKMEEENGFKYTDEQRNAIRMACEHNVLILNGKGGTGKTFTVKGILKAMEHYNHVCAALSGKASNILSSHGLNAKTIHRMLGFNPKGGFLHDIKNKLKEHVFVIDESSMANNYLFYSILIAIPDGAKVIIVGDSGQLAGIGAGNVFADLLEANIFPQQELTIVQRQAAKSGILSCANEIRDGKQIISRGSYNKQVFGELNDFVVFPMKERDEIKELVLDITKKWINKPLLDFQIITALKSRGDVSVKGLNIEAQKILNSNVADNANCVQRGSYSYYGGDKVIHCGNNYEAGENFDTKIFNGTLGVIERIELAKDPKLDYDKIFIQFEGIEDVIMYKKDELDMIELAYVITTHRSQGSTIPYTIFAFDYLSYALLSRQMAYTAITRASKGCVMVCEGKALHHAIKTDHSGKRNTFLKDLLVGFNQLDK